MKSKGFWIGLILIVVLLGFILYIRVHRKVKEEKFWEEVELYLADFNSPGGPFLVPVKVKIEKDNVLASAMDLLTSPPLYIKGVTSPLPPGTKCLSAEIQGDTAYINFSKELKDNFSGGSTNEMLVVYSIVNTACSIKGIKKAQILIEGKETDSLGGHIDISYPLEPDRELVK